MTAHSWRIRYYRDEAMTRLTPRRDVFLLITDETLRRYMAEMLKQHPRIAVAVATRLDNEAIQIEMCR